MASRKKSSRKRSVQRKGVSGNPQRRAEQLRPRLAGDDSAMMDIAYSLAGGAKPSPWWPESHQRILGAARGLAWPSRLVDVETLACQLVGDEFYARIDSPEGGLHPAQWLVALAEETGAALHTSVQNGASDWCQLWALLCGLALMAPQPSALEENDDLRVAREMFPDIHDPFEVAQAEAAKAGKLLVGLGLAVGGVTAADGPRPAGEAVFARDVYGSRVLLAAPFGYGGDEADHWYAWDIDLCWTHLVVGAGVFGSAQDALAEWQDAVGAPASGAALAPCPADTTPVLLDSCLATGPFSDMLDGAEPRELIREYYRMRRRARALAWPGGAGGGVPFDYGPAYQAFLGWYAARHDDAAEDVGGNVATILQSWGPRDYPDEYAFYACSPHRLQMTAHLTRRGYAPQIADEVLLLLPEWTRWCLSQGGVDGEFAGRSLETARAMASLAGSKLVTGGSPEGEAPFRRQE